MTSPSSRHADLPFAARHIGPDAASIAHMLEVVGAPSVEALMAQVVPEGLAGDAPPDVPPALSERQALARLREYADGNEIWRSYLGMGYSGTLVPNVIKRNVLENPAWYTAYTPYQAEISQGRLEALLNFQTMVQDLTGLEVAGASLLDEATAAAEAMTMALRMQKRRKDAKTFLVDARCHPQTIAVIRTRAEPLGIRVVVDEPRAWSYDQPVFGVVAQYPATDGSIADLEDVIQRAHEAKAFVVLATDLLALTLLRSPGELGADIAVGSSQRFGVPMGYGGPHAAFLATRSTFVRQMPGRLIGVTKDAQGRPALRMALQTREQHIRRERATSNICTAQVLLAVIASMYAVWHGPDGLTRIAKRVRQQAWVIAAAARRAGFEVADTPFFDTVVVETGSRTTEILRRARDRRINLRDLGDERVAVALDETVTDDDLDDLLGALLCPDSVDEAWAAAGAAPDLGAHARSSTFLEHPTFHRYRSETEMMRYLRRLQNRDLGLDTAMIPLGSCTMKLNAVAEMAAVTWDGFGGLHPFVPKSQAQGYQRLFGDLEGWLAAITRFDAVSLQPNAGSQGEYAGLLLIRRYHEHRGEGHRDVCLIPKSAHGTNPASAMMAGMKVVVVNCNERGDIDVEDLEAKARKYADRLSALMITYPSTHGVFEASIRQICEIIHGFGGQVYLDGANLNALVGQVYAAELGADVCHINLHKTFAIPHGGGGPGMGPVCVRAHLAPYLPGHPVVATGGEQAIGAISAAPWGSSSILPISWAFIAMLGPEGLRRTAQVAILSANYISKRLEGHYDTLYTGDGGRVAHECILDLRPLKGCGVTAEDVAKRLMDYGFHAPTMSWPVAGTLMVEPTESESLAEVDRFIEAMIAIRDEIRAVERGEWTIEESPLRNAPHTARVLASEWDRRYSREQAVFPTEATRMDKYWPTVGRVDNAHGDRNLMCSCPPIESYSE